jgi:hypothetical protein
MKHPIMRRLQQLVVTFSLLLLVFAANGQVQTARYISMTPNSNGFYEYLPQGYGSGSQTYPLLLFIHGTGELGDGSPSQLPKVLVNGPPRLINVNQFPASFTVNGITKSFIVISPQFTAWPSSSDIDNIINYATQHYRVDLNRIYLTGLSMGGGVVWEYAGGSSANANRLAGLFPVCGASYPDLSRGRTMANANLPIWAFHNDQDGTVPVWYTNDYIDYINQAPAPNPIAKKSIFVNASHDAWTKAYDPNYRENNMNVYEYMLQFQRNGAPSNNLTPSVNAGPDQSISASSAQLNASASDPDGSIVSYSWSRLAGPTQFTLSNSSIPNPTLSNLAAGRYTFRVVVTDNQGATAYDDINIVITASIPAKIEAEGYANMSGVQAETTQDVGGGQNVGYIDYNDWMEYNLNVPAAGTYNVNFRISAPTAGAQFQVKDAAGAVLATVIVPNTGGYQTWQTISSSVVLPAGAQVVRLVSTNSTNWNFNWLGF